MSRFPQWATNNDKHHVIPQRLPKFALIFVSGTLVSYCDTGIIDKNKTIIKFLVLPMVVKNCESKIFIKIICKIRNTGFCLSLIAEISKLLPPCAFMLHTAMGRLQATLSKEIFVIKAKSESTNIWRRYCHEEENPRKLAKMWKF